MLPLESFKIGVSKMPFPAFPGPELINWEGLKGIKKNVHNEIIVFVIVWFQKISRPPPRRELEIPGGWGGSEAQEIPKGRGVGP